MIKGLACFLLCVGGLLSSARAGDAPETWGLWTQWGDQGDGTYRNPVLPSDYSDIDCIRVGSDYYAISSTFQYSPGMVILHSKDLVNWTILSHVISDVTQMGPAFNWDRMDRYGRGVWAGAIRYHDHRFWVYFGTPDEGYFMSTAAHPAGPWTPLHQTLAAVGWDDCCPFWDDDGQGYLAGTCFKEGYKTYLFKLTPDGRDIIPDSGIIINQGMRREASKLYKINGLYYHFFSEYDSKKGRYCMMQRSSNIAGPYTEVKQLSHAQKAFREPNQGGIVQTEQGDWYFFTHHGSGSWEGRCNSLLPVTWQEGWPILGQVGEDGMGTMVWSGRKPVPDAPRAIPQTSDDFSCDALPPQWEWNHQPRADKWSLTERRGWLRLYAFKPLELDDPLKAGNTLTQRCFRSSANEVIVKLDLSAMADGQKAGLCHYAKTHAALGVAQQGVTRTLEYRLDGRVTAGPRLTANTLWIRSTWGLDGKSQFAYSLEGRVYTDLGGPYALSWGHYRGDRLGLYSYNNQAEAGFLDVDYFSYTVR
ncbi:MAG: glycoside hydrolase 43 family protein [Phycisphaerae bacterium]|nr:glycoside hydrolase 43 family protein [Phycisphaerae bacterium]